MNTSSQTLSERKYGRDFLLQLRLHPFSLQKPKNLKNLDIVKNRLYLHQMNNSSALQNESSSYSTCPIADAHSASKYDVDSVFRYQRSLPEYIPRNCSLYGQTMRCNAATPVTSHSKHRSIFFPDYINPMRKLSFQCPSEYKLDLLSDEMFSSPMSSPIVSWSKHYPYEDLWNCQSRSCATSSASKLNVEVGKNKKNPLPIINPLNGKNVLEDSPTFEEEMKPKSMEKLSTDMNEETTEDNNSLERCCKEVKTVDLNVASDGDTESSSQKVLLDNQDCSLSQKGVSVDKARENLKKKETLQLLETSLSVVPQKYSAMGPIEPSSTESQEQLMQVNDENIPFTNFDDNISSSTSNQRCYASLPPASNNPKRCLFSVDENTRKLEDQLKTSISLLKEKRYAMRQEQQKMAIVQSFLRLKKHQLDESFRSLDDKKIEIANWECNIASKEKRLVEKECLLEAKRQLLKNMEEKLQSKSSILHIPTESSDKVIEVGDTFQIPTSNQVESCCRKSKSLEGISNLEKDSASGNGENGTMLDNEAVLHGCDVGELSKEIGLVESISDVKVGDGCSVDEEK